MAEDAQNKEAFKMLSKMVVGGILSGSKIQDILKNWETWKTAAPAPLQIYKNGFTLEQVEKLRYYPPPYTNLNEIATIACRSPKTILRYIKQRRIPVMNKGKHGLLFDTQKVLVALSKCA